MNARATQPDVTDADIAIAERILRKLNHGHEPYAGAVLPAARLLKLYRLELVDMALAVDAKERT